MKRNYGWDPILVEMLLSHVASVENPLVSYKTVEPKTNKNVIIVYIIHLSIAGKPRRRKAHAAQSISKFT